MLVTEKGIIKKCYYQVVKFCEKMQSPEFLNVLALVTLENHNVCTSKHDTTGGLVFSFQVFLLNTLCRVFIFIFK